MTKVQKLVARLRAMGVEIPDDYTFGRTHAGHWQRSAGAWSWFIARPRMCDLGGYVSVTELLAAPSIVVEDEDSFRVGGITVEVAS